MRQMTGKNLTPCLTGRQSVSNYRDTNGKLRPPFQLKSKNHSIYSRASREYPNTTRARQNNSRVRSHTRSHSRSISSKRPSFMRDSTETAALSNSLFYNEEPLNYNEALAM